MLVSCMISLACSKLQNPGKYGHGPVVDNWFGGYFCDVLHTPALPALHGKQGKSGAALSCSIADEQYARVADGI